MTPAELALIELNEPNARVWEWDVIRSCWTNKVGLDDTSDSGERIVDAYPAHSIRIYPIQGKIKPWSPRNPIQYVVSLNEVWIPGNYDSTVAALFSVMEMSGEDYSVLFREETQPWSLRTLWKYRTRNATRSNGE